VVAGIAWFAVDGFVVADAKEGDDCDEDGDDEEKVENVLGEGEVRGRRGGGRIE
jgi:hypothetical protein